MALLPVRAAADLGWRGDGGARRGLCRGGRRSAARGGVRRHDADGDLRFSRRDRHAAGSGRG